MRRPNERAAETQVQRTSTVRPGARASAGPVVARRFATLAGAALTVLLASRGGLAFAEAPPPPPPAPAPAAETAASSGRSNASAGNASAGNGAPGNAAGATGSTVPPPPPVVVAPAPTGLAPAPRPVITAAATSSAAYGVAMRARWVSIPKWVLNAFTQANVPLSSYHIGAEFFRRKGSYDLVLGLSYQNMSPPDGNWLGPAGGGYDPSQDTDYVQFKGLGIVSFDVGFVWHQAFTDWFGMHYGGGIGLGVVTGKILRTSSWSSCTKANINDVSQCHPKGVYPITEQALQRTEGNGMDQPDSPVRFREDSVPSVVPVLNIVLGLDFKIPTIPGLEMRVEGGIFDAFFLGGAIGYVFL